MGLWLSWLERTPDKREVDGSSPFRPIYIEIFLTHGALAQLGERLLCKQEVIGSIPLSSIDSASYRTCSLKTRYLFYFLFNEKPRKHRVLKS